MASRSGGDTSSFPWLTTTPAPSEGPNRRNRVAASELADRAGLYFRLGYTAKDATARLCQRIAWEYDTGKRPAALSDDAVAKIVSDTFARRPG